MTVSKSGSDPRQSRRVWLGGLSAAVLAALLLLGVGDRLSRPLFDAWQRMSPRDLAGTDVRVVLIDADSLATIGPWPWPRYHMARLTEEIAAQHPAAIGFDMIFAESDRMKPEIFAGLYPELSPAAIAEIVRLQSMDQLFGQVLGRAPAILARAAIADGPSGGPDLPVEATFAGALPPDVPAFPGAMANIPELDGVALGHGLVNGPPDDDGIVRRVPMLLRVGGRPMPGFALELARIGLDQDKVTTGRTTVALGDRRVPVDREGRMALRFGAMPPGSIINALAVLQRAVPAGSFTGKTVLIGLAAEGSADIVATPLAAEAYGTLVQAQAVDAIRRGGWLVRPAWAGAAEWATGGLLVLLIVGLGSRGRTIWWMVPLALAVSIPVGAWLAFDLGALLLDPLKPIALGGASLAGVAGGLFLEARRERERLRDALLTERLAAAATEGELQAARSIQLGMLPPPETLASLDPRIEIAALLEPARSIGGDLYDVIRLDADRIAFVVGDVTGKGVPAALFMALSKALTKSVLLRDPDGLGVAAEILNAELSRDNSEAMNVTMILGVIDLASGEVRLVSAGHEDPIHIRADGSVAPVKLEGGPPFCVVDYPYPQEQMTLLPGEALVVLTDGIGEAQNAARQLFGNALATVAAHAGEDMTAMVASIRDAVRVFEAGTEPTDDLTAMAIRYRPI
jgi:adenylate cyclase